MKDDRRQSGFVARQCKVSVNNTSEGHLEIACMRHSSAPAVLRPATTWSVRNNGTRACRAALYFEEIGKWLAFPQKTRRFSRMVFINYLRNVPMPKLIFLEIFLKQKPERILIQMLFENGASAKWRIYE